MRIMKNSLLIALLLALPCLAQTPALDPAINSVFIVKAVTASNTTEVRVGSKMPRALYVGVTGDVSILLQDSTTVTLVGLAAGIWHPIIFRRVRSTGTTATSILVGR